MVRIPGLLMIELILCALMNAPAAQGSDTVRTLTGLEERLALAWVQRDREFIEELLAPEWSVIDPSGAALTRTQVLDRAFGSNERRIELMNIDDVNVRVLGQAAVVAGRTRATGSYKGQRATAVLRFTDVFVFREGRWVIVASHASNVAPAQ